MTNQNKDYSWLFTPLQNLFHAGWSAHKASLVPGNSNIRSLEEQALADAEAAIRQKIDEHYIGNGEACSSCNGEGDYHDPTGEWRGKCDDCNGTGFNKLYTESDVEQRCIEARIDPFDFVEPCEPDCSPERHAYHQGQWDMAERLRQLSTNNKDTLERSE